LRAAVGELRAPLVQLQADAEVLALAVEQAAAQFVVALQLAIGIGQREMHAEEQQRADVQSRRREWFAGQLDLDPTKLVFIDETGASTNLARKSGRCRRGRHLRAAIPHSHYKTVTLVAGLRLRGLTAAKTFDGPINAALFEDWL
jgi:hypothetical protein